MRYLLNQLYIVSARSRYERLFFSVGFLHLLIQFFLGLFFKAFFFLGILNRFNTLDLPFVKFPWEWGRGKVQDVGAEQGICAERGMV